MKLFLCALLLAASAAAQTSFEKLDRDLTQAAAELHLSHLRAEVSESGRVVWKRGAVDTCARAGAPGRKHFSGSDVEWWFQPKCVAILVPAKLLEFVVSANSNLLTEAPRLEDGNILRSPVALAFLEDVAGFGGLERDEEIDRALIALYFGQRAESTVLTRQALNRFPDLPTQPDVTLLYLFSSLNLPETEDSATAVIKAHPDLPTAWFYYAQFLEGQKRYREAAACYHKITDHQPPLHNSIEKQAREELTHLETAP